MSLNTVQLPWEWFQHIQQPLLTSSYYDCGAAMTPGSTMPHGNNGLLILSYCQYHSSSSWLQLPTARHKIEEVSCEAAQLHALNSTYLSAVGGVYYISLPCFYIQMHGINVLLPAGLFINERTLKYFEVCLILACTLHTWKFNLFLITWYSFFPTFTLCQFCWNLRTAVWKPIVSFCFTLSAKTSLMSVENGNIQISWPSY